MLGKAYVDRREHVGTIDRHQTGDWRRPVDTSKKTQALKILAGKLKPNLGRYDAPPDWAEILTYFSISRVLISS